MAQAKCKQSDEGRNRFGIKGELIFYKETKNGYERLKCGIDF